MFKWFKRDSDVKTLEKDLANIASKISKNEAHLSSLRSGARRIKGAITLYGVLIYAVYVAIWFLFYRTTVGKTRRRLLSALPIILLPLAIYLLREGLSAFYNRRIHTEEGNLETLKSMQKEKIEEFKNKTDFYTTKSLIDRYSGENSTSSAPTTPVLTRTKQLSQLASGSPAVRQSSRLQSQSLESPQQGTPASLHGTIATPKSLSGLPQTDTTRQAEFAPNAEAPSYIQGPSHWYDRILDVVIGEDEANEHSRYQLEQKLRSRDEKISALEVELMKLRTMFDVSDKGSANEANPVVTTATDSQMKQSVKSRKTTKSNKSVEAVNSEDDKSM